MVDESSEWGTPRPESPTTVRGPNVRNITNLRVVTVLRAWSGVKRDSIKFLHNVHVIRYTPGFAAYTTDPNEWRGRNEYSWSK